LGASKFDFGPILDPFWDPCWHRFS
jgi:hypothetical protein